MPLPLNPAAPVQPIYDLWLRPNYFIRMTAKNKQFGFGGIEKYY
jgi:hypothetical protein